ncbi:MAG: hypothetical protein JW864_16520, partial [Spirochaetes bacterium]|nr:hypothetical protein [Spirochaetota bacterium]
SNKRKESSINLYYLKEMGKDYIKSNSTHQIVIDYMSGMTDDFFNNEFKEYTIPKNFGFRLNDKK